ncbi:PREDICTED: uncharacterized protein LOC108354031, partial [Rhagoletis zephyria]|uniref:uncharacterized protein LOC108354031 n=1 Tax=Rhagoletis zephyria TaxID=28612 RepID=UPI00081150FE
MTTFVEDMPTAGLWTFHGRNGFGEQQPLEYLIRPVSMVVWDQLENDFCYKGRLEMEFYYDFVYDQLLAFRERRQPHLTFIHMSTVVHEEPNNAAYADEPVRRFLEKIFAANLQQNTAILFYSDHGFRFGPISKTESGYHESRLPFMYWYIPEGLTLGDGLDAGQIRKNLRTNSRRLASQFDVHSTLLHILHGKPSPLPLSADKFFLDHTFGHSLFTELPLNRTCEEAGIPEEYCLCRRFVPLTDAHSRHLLGEFILEHLNEQLAPYSANCTPLSLGRILETKVS